MCRPNIGYITLIVNRKLKKKGGGVVIPCQERLLNTPEECPWPLLNTRYL